MDPAPAAAEGNAAVPPPAGAVVVNVAAAAVAAPARRAAASRARNPRGARATLALALLVLGFATASLALFAASLPAADAGVLVQGRRCSWTEEEAADMREEAGVLLLAASTQVLSATAMLLVPALPFVVVALAVGSYTAFSAADVVWMLLACHGRVHGVAAFHYWFFYAVMLGTLLVGGFVVARS